MKKLLLITTLLVGITACNIADDGDYNEMATDMCECFNEGLEGLSDGGKRAIVDAGKNDSDMQAALMEYGQEHTMEAMQDAKVLESLQDGNVMECVGGLEKKYEDVYSSDSDEVKQEKLVEAMKGIKICELTYALVKAGMLNHFNTYIMLVFYKSTSIFLEIILMSSLSFVQAAQYPF